MGWRVNSQFGDVRPQAQISYNQQFGENIWKKRSRVESYDRRKSGGKLAGCHRRRGRVT